MYWKIPHINKVYEALSAIADNRIQLISNTKGRQTSTSGNKFYTITYDPTTGAMMSDDNVAYWTDSISHAMIAFLLKTGRIDYNPKFLPYLANIKWKDINQKFKNDFDKSTEYILSELQSRDYPIDSLIVEINRIYKMVCCLKIEQFGKKIKPSTAY